MTDSRPNLIDETAIRRYLLCQLSERELEQFEHEIFVDEDLFAQVAATEDDLVDEYVAGELSPDDRDLFESSMTRLPARQRKIRNARVISTFIGDEKSLMSPLPVLASETKIGLWAKLVELFEFRTPTLGFALTGFSLLLLVSTLSLFWSNRGLREENVRLHSSTGNLDDLRSREQKLNQSLDESKAREAELTARINDESEAKEDLTSDLIRERENRKQLEAQIARLDRSPNRSSGDATTGQSVETLSLGNSPPQTPEMTTTVKIGDAAKQIAIVVSLPDRAVADGPLTVIINGKQIGGTFFPKADDKGRMHITVSAAVRGLQPGANKITVTNSSGTVLTTYSFSTAK